MGKPAGSILLVDDECDFLELAQEMLEAAGFQVTAVSSSVRAVEMVRAGYRPSALLLDYRMPCMTGPEALQAIRESGCTAPAALVSAMINLEDTAMENGFSAFLGKPFTVDAIIRLARSLIDEPNPCMRKAKEHERHAISHS